MRKFVLSVMMLLSFALLALPALSQDDDLENSVNDISLPETYILPWENNGSFSLSYPDNWVLREYDGNFGLGLFSSEEVADLVETHPSPIPFDEGDIAMFIDLTLASFVVQTPSQYHLGMLENEANRVSESEELLLGGDPAIILKTNNTLVGLQQLRINTSGEGMPKLRIARFMGSIAHIDNFVPQSIILGHPETVDDNMDLLLAVVASLTFTPTDLSLVQSSSATIGNGSEISISYPSNWVFWASNEEGVVFISNDDAILNPDWSYEFLLENTYIELRIWTEAEFSVQDVYDNASDDYSDAEVSSLINIPVGGRAGGIYFVTNETTLIRQQHMIQIRDGYSVEIIINAPQNVLQEDFNLFEEIIESVEYTPADGASNVRTEITADNLPELTQEYSETLNNRTLSLRYPESWTFEPGADDDGAVYLANDDAILSPDWDFTFEDSQVYMVVRASEQTFGTPQEVYESRSNNDDLELSELEELTLGGDEAGIFSVSMQGFDMVELNILRVSDDYVIEVLVYSLPDDLDANRELILAIVSSVEYTPAED